MCKHEAFDYALGLPVTQTIDLFTDSRVGCKEASKQLDFPPRFPFFMQVERFDRTFEENEELGLNDINTDDYETLPEGYVRPLATLIEGQEEEEEVEHHIPHRVGTDHPIPFTKGQEEADDTRADGLGRFDR